MTPEYYKFPSGVQPIEIARYLNSNGGQILGYIARSTRIDGNNKHENPLDDLMKARDLLHDEIARVQELQEAGDWDEDEEGEPHEARSWSRLNDVPTGLSVVDNKGYSYRYRYEHRQWLMTDPEGDDVGLITEDWYGPYTEKKP